ncbi:hypothetical protein DEO72_LG3g849 [Vigna unguiculata]|uniref:Uncharacterized protein n=1 Tax=Vigna unguiculata TaxID=3917 RepID=A0A4D6LCU0_VIGUN|nr:hypothetical protein DEO72_LG3g849 [Vigna unguiculata]
MSGEVHGWWCTRDDMSGKVHIRILSCGDTSEEMLQARTFVVGGSRMLDYEREVHCVGLRVRRSLHINNIKFCDDIIKLLGKSIHVPQIAHSDAIAVNLAGIARSNAFIGGADERLRLKLDGNDYGKT